MPRVSHCCVSVPEQQDMKQQASLSPTRARLRVPSQLSPTHCDSGYTQLPWLLRDNIKLVDRFAPLGSTGIPIHRVPNQLVSQDSTVKHATYEFQPHRPSRKFVQPGPVVVAPHFCIGKQQPVHEQVQLGNQIRKQKPNATRRAHAVQCNRNSIQKPEKKTHSKMFRMNATFRRLSQQTMIEECLMKETKKSLTSKVRQARQETGVRLLRRKRQHKREIQSQIQESGKKQSQCDRNLFQRAAMLRLKINEKAKQVSQRLQVVSGCSHDQQDGKVNKQLNDTNEIVSDSINCDQRETETSLILSRSNDGSRDLVCTTSTPYQECCQEVNMEIRDIMVSIDQAMMRLMNETKSKLDYGMSQEKGITKQQLGEDRKQEILDKWLHQATKICQSGLQRFSSKMIQRSRNKVKHLLEKRHENHKPSLDHIDHSILTLRKRRLAIRGVTRRSQEHLEKKVTDLEREIKQLTSGLDSEMIKRVLRVESLQTQVHQLEIENQRILSEQQSIEESGTHIVAQSESLKTKAKLLFDTTNDMKVSNAKLQKECIVLSNRVASVSNELEQLKSLPDLADRVSGRFIRQIFECERMVKEEGFATKVLSDIVVPVVCSQCVSEMDDPVTLVPCGHLLCRSCARNCLREGRDHQPDTVNSCVCETPLYLARRTAWQADLIGLVLGKTTRVHCPQCDMCVPAFSHRNLIAEKLSRLYNTRIGCALDNELLCTVELLRECMSTTDAE